MDLLQDILIVFADKDTAYFTLNPDRILYG
jgi:hypothetical protein